MSGLSPGQRAATVAPYITSPDNIWHMRYEGIMRLLMDFKFQIRHVWNIRYILSDTYYMETLGWKPIHDTR